jgi:hypothetical protein
MKNYDASKTDGTPLYCIMCEREIPDRNWFARIPLGDCRVAVCRPACAEMFLDNREACAQKIGTGSSVLSAYVST